mmetsp:Transcript_31702/g.98051  ORF Transcript_31702/g.98051 Transcript_31702/m.98051 type:complete len:420 (-) Transcript_31702:25-1284(-)
MSSSSTMCGCPCNRFIAMYSVKAACSSSSVAHSITFIAISSGGRFVANPCRFAYEPRRRTRYTWLLTPSPSLRMKRYFLVYSAPVRLSKSGCDSCLGCERRPFFPRAGGGSRCDCDWLAAASLSSSMLLNAPEATRRTPRTRAWGVWVPDRCSRSAVLSDESSSSSPDLATDRCIMLGSEEPPPMRCPSLRMPSGISLSSIPVGSARCCWMAYDGRESIVPGARGTGPGSDSSGCSRSAAAASAGTPTAPRGNWGGAALTCDAVGVAPGSRSNRQTETVAKITATVTYRPTKTATATSAYDRGDGALRSSVVNWRAPGGGCTSSVWSMAPRRKHVPLVALGPFPPPVCSNTAVPLCPSSAQHAATFATGFRGVAGSGAVALNVCGTTLTVVLHVWGAAPHTPARSQQTAIPTHRPFIGL